MTAPRIRDGVLELSNTELHHARRLGIRAALLGYHNRDLIHYSQRPDRWAGIDQHLRSYKGEFPRTADCSAFATWVLWDATRKWAAPDFVNGTRWTSGHTGTMDDHGQLLGKGLRSYLEHLRPLDLVLYGNEGWRAGHVAVYVGDGKVVSHGSEPGPFLLPVSYRRDVHSARR